MTKGAAIKYSAAEIAFVDANKSLDRKTITERFNARFNRNLSIDNIKRLCIRQGWRSADNGCFKPGQKTWNKGLKGLKGFMGANVTSFKKGMTPHNHKPVGWLRITVDGYLEIKVAEPKKFKAVHRIVYENHIGPIPKGHVVVFRDGDSHNVDPDNLVAICRLELSQLNRLGHKRALPEVQPVLLTLAKVKAKTSALISSRNKSNSAQVAA